MCRGCRAAVARGHQVVGLPCEHRHGMHTRCVVEAIRRGGPHAQLICGSRGCTALHGRRESLKAAAQADPGLCVTVVGPGGRPDNNWGERREDLCYPWDLNSLRMAGQLDDVSLETPTTLHNRCQSAAGASYCPRQAPHSRAQPAEPRPWSASAKQTLRDAEFAPEGHQVVVHRASTAALAG